MSSLPIAVNNSAVLQRLVNQAESTFQSRRASATTRAYKHDWEMFSTWCLSHELPALPASPESIILYATDLTKNDCRSLNTLYRRLAAISQTHQQAGHDSPTRAWVVKQFLAGLRRELTIAPVRKRPVLAEDLREILETIPDTTIGKRDRALLLLGFTGAFRRSELVGLDVADITNVRDGVIARIRRSKTDQEGAGRSVGIPSGKPGACPVEALRTWCCVASIGEGPIFRRIDRHGNIFTERLSGEGVAIVVKRYAEALGYDPDLFGGHSLRSGLATSAAAAGKSERAIMNQTGHRSLTTVRRYIREGSLFRENAADGIGL